MEAYSDLHRRHLVRDHLPDEQPVQYLEVMHGQGRGNYPVRAIWTALVAGDEAARRCRGLEAGEVVHIDAGALSGLLVGPEWAHKQLDEEVRETPKPGVEEPRGGRIPETEPGPDERTPGEVPPPKPRRFHGRVKLDAGRTGRDAGKIAREVLAHLVGLVGAEVTVTLEISARVPDGVPENVVRIVTENCWTLKFEDQGFEVEYPGRAVSAA